MDQIWNWNGEKWNINLDIPKGKIPLRLGMIDDKICIEMDSLLSLLWKTQIQFPDTRKVMGAMIEFLGTINEQLKERSDD